MYKDGKWFKEDRESFVNGSLNLFRFSEKKSTRSQASIDREANIDTLMSRITNQLYSYYERGLPWDTPEDWDNSLNKIDGGQSCRKSQSILSRISWDKFVIKCNELLEDIRLDDDE